MVRPVSLAGLKCPSVLPGSPGAAYFPEIPGVYFPKWPVPQNHFFPASEQLSGVPTLPDESVELQYKLDRNKKVEGQSQIGYSSVITPNKA